MPRFTLTAGDDLFPAGQNTTGNDFVQALAGDDTVDGGLGNDSIFGGAGDDRLSGGAGHDLLRADSGADTLLGGEGGDTLEAGQDMLALADHPLMLDGGAGVDTLELGIASEAAGVALTLTNGGGQLRLGGQLLAELAGLERLILQTGNGDNRINLAAAPHEHTIVSGAGDDLIITSSGTDWIEAGAGADTVRAGAGNDFVRALLGGGSLDLDGGAGNDDWLDLSADELEAPVSLAFVAGSWAVQVAGRDMGGLAGFEQLELALGVGDDRFAGGGAREIVVAGDGDDWLNGAAGHDALVGGMGNDTLLGGSGNDVLDAGDGADLLRAGVGDDRVSKELGRYDLFGGAGNDELSASFERAAGPVLFNALSGKVTIGGQDHGQFAEFEQFWIGGSAGADTLIAGGGDDFLKGEAGGDVLRGGHGNDLIIEDLSLQDGAIDRLYGGAGADDLNLWAVGARTRGQVYGGAGADQIAMEFSAGRPVLASALMVDGGAGHDLLMIGAEAVRESLDLRALDLRGIEEITLEGGRSLAVHLDVAQLDGVAAVRGNRVDLHGAGRIALVDWSVEGTRLDDGAQDFSVTVGNGFAAKWVSGGGGNDTLAGLNEMAGGAGDDLLLAGRMAAGKRLWGDSGADTFRFDSLTDLPVAESRAARILDLAVEEGDRIDLSLIDAVTETAEDDSFVFIGEAAFSAVGQVRVVSSAGYARLEFNVDGSDSAEAVLMLWEVELSGLDAGIFIL